MTYASWIPEGSSLTIESDEGIMPLAYGKGSVFGATFGYPNSGGSNTLVSSSEFFSYPYTSSVQPSIITIDDLVISQAVNTLLTLSFTRPDNTYLYGSTLYRLNASVPAKSFFNCTFGAYASDTTLLMFSPSDNSVALYNDDAGNLCFYTPFYLDGSYKASIISRCLGWDRSLNPGLSFVDGTLYSGGSYPDVSFLYSLRPRSYTTKPVYFNAIQVYFGAESRGAYNGGLIMGSSGFRILNDYIPPANDIYSFDLAVFNNPGGTGDPIRQVNMTVNPSAGKGNRISTTVGVTQYDDILNASALTVQVVFDGSTKISDIEFTLGGSSSTTAYMLLGQPTVVHDSFANYLLYQPGSSLSGGSGSDVDLQPLIDAIESADSNNVDAVEAAQSIITANADANANKQIQAAESIASEEMSQAESQHQELIHGYDVDSSAEASNSALESAVDELASIESQIDSQISDGVSSLESLFEPANWNEVSQGFAVINNLINRLYDGAGIWQIVFQLTLILGLASMLLAGYMFVTGRLHRK